MLLRVAALLFVAQLLHSANAGVNYIRWGRTTCEGGATVIYKGYAAGSYWGDLGSGNNHQCLPEDPHWARTVAGVQGATGFIYGTEYEMNSEYAVDGNLFSFKNNAGKSIHDEDVPCVACYQSDRTALIVIPARTNCSTEGWNLEYSGYLVSQDKGRIRSEYLCVDGTPEVVPGGSGDKPSQNFFPVQVKCGSLQCPKYVDGYEVACAVCSI